LDQALDALRNAGFDAANAGGYVSWMRQYILFHDKRHPQDMGMPEVDAFLASGTFAGPDGRFHRAEARRALQFLYEEVLHRRWPRRAENAPAQRRRAKKAVYLNGQQKDVKLLDRMRNAMRVGQYALDTEKAYVDWARRYILFHQKRHPQEMGAMEVEQFLTHLAVQRQVSPSTRKQALCALVFLHETVLGMELGQVMPVRGRHGLKIPVGMSRNEVSIVLDCVRGANGLYRLACEVMYGSGTRVRETCRTRVKDVDSDRLQLVVRDGKGNRDRVTVLPQRLDASNLALVLIASNPFSLSLHNAKFQSPNLALSN